MTLPTELIYVLAAVIVGAVLFRFFSGHGGVRISRRDLGSLPPDGEVTVRGHPVRWRSADDGSFVAGWPLADGHVVAMRVTFDGDPEAGVEDADQGLLELSIDRRPLARNVRWTDQIRDRTLRADAEAILRMLAREARGGTTERKRIATAKPVTRDREIGGS
jgi:hypothetical protein